MDENINLEGLEKAVGYFNNIYATNFQDIVNGFALLTDHARMLSAASDSLVVDSHRVQIMMQVYLSAWRTLQFGKFSRSFLFDVLLCRLVMREVMLPFQSRIY